MSKSSNALMIKALSEYCVEDRLDVFHQVLSKRTKSIRLVFENPRNPRNIAAALRTADAFGVQYIDIVIDQEHISGNWKDFRSHTVSAGAYKWLTISFFDSIQTCYAFLKKEGYIVFAMAPPLKANLSVDACIDSQDKISQYNAFIFGSEETGVSEYIFRVADYVVFLEMVGFVESFNLSASVAILCTLLKKYFVSNLDEIEKEKIFFDWLCKSVKSSEKILKHLGFDDVSRS